MVCDNMLQGLGRYLRCLGVDVRMLENEDDHRKAAEVSGVCVFITPICTPWSSLLNYQLVTLRSCKHTAESQLSGSAQEAVLCGNWNLVVPATVCGLGAPFPGGRK